jgi:asparagine synthase (glutamine-hydrolysing)
MCGITGWFSSLPIDPATANPRLAAMVRAIAHRGPDGEGTKLEQHAALGHRRLAIIDLETGSQPLTSSDGSVSIIFNGEIYNYRKLRQQLIQTGEHFQTNSDTEVILKIYQRDGWQGFSKLRGMYAFAIWDQKRQSGILARDPYGIKPLFLSWTKKGELSFGSEAKAILAGGQDAELNSAALHLLMNFRYLPGERSLFNNIHQLTPGTVLEWQQNGSINHHNITPPKQNSGDDILEALQQSVDLHLTADVEVGAYLSGGIDSAAIVSLAKSRDNGNLRTFTVKVGDDPNEAANAAKTAQLFGLENIQSESHSNPAEELMRLTWHLELPKINSWQVAELARHTAQHVKVALSGLGGDELFYGYNIHSILHYCSSLHSALPNSISRSAGSFSAYSAKRLLQAPWTEQERASLMLSNLGDWPKVYALLRNIWDNPDLRKQIYGPRMLDAKLPDAFEVTRELWPDTQDPVTAANQFEWRHKMVNDLLWQEDRCSMAAGLEVRVPFVDQSFANTVHTLDRKQLMPNGRRKGFMKELLQNTLPKEIVNRPKSGFQVDAPTFFNRELKYMADKWLSEEQINKRGLFNPKFVKTVRQYKPRKGLRWHYFILYLMLTTHLWCEIFEDGQWVTTD